MRERTFWRRLSSQERGASAIITALLLVVLFLGAALVIDIGSQVLRRQTVRNATDAAVLAGASFLPNDPNAARAAAMQYALENDPNLQNFVVDVTYRCLIGDRDSDSKADTQDVPGACNPGPDGMGRFTCDRELCSAPCEPNQGDVCNTIVAETSEDVPFHFAPGGGGAAKGTTGVVRSAACAGFCGAPPKAPIDIGIVIDRTASMSSSDLANAKNAALAMLGYLDPKYHNVALGVIHKSSTARTCSGTNYGRSINNSEYSSGSGTWIAAPHPAAPLFSDYQRTDGSLNTSSKLVRTIQCLETSSFMTQNGQTDLGNPLEAMKNYLLSRGRANVPKVIVFETDGEANLPNGTQPCAFAVGRATSAKNAGVEIYTIGFGIAGKRCGQDTSGSYRNALVTKVIADMASQPSADNGCVAAENADGDHFFCEPRSADLSTVFVRVASDIVGRPRIVRLPA